MIENTAQDQEQEPELQIEVTDDPVEEESQPAPLSPDDELDTYTKGVSKRINKLNAATRAAEQRAQQYEQLAMQKERELQQYRQIAQQQQNSMTCEKNLFQNK